MILDELARLQTLPSLPYALSESRKSNTRMVLGLQERSQIQARYGREAEAMLSQPRTKIFLRTSEPNGAEWVSKSIGEVEIEHLREGRNAGGMGFRRSKNATVERRIEAAVLASEISNLPDLEGYFQTPGYTLRLTFQYFKPKKLLPAFIPADVPVPLSLAVPDTAAEEPLEHLPEDPAEHTQVMLPGSPTTTEEGEAVTN